MLNSSSWRYFLYAFILNVFLALIILILFSLLHVRFHFFQRVTACRMFLEKAGPQKDLRRPFAWILPVLRMTEDEIIDKCGMDAAVFLRMFLFSIQLFTFLCILSMTIIVPINVSGTNGLRTTVQNGGLDDLSTANIASGSPLLWAHWAMSYVYSGLALTLIWLTYAHVFKLRHRFMARRSARVQLEQYTILVTDIPYRPPPQRTPPPAPVPAPKSAVITKSNSLLSGAPSAASSFRRRASMAATHHDAPSGKDMAPIPADEVPSRPLNDAETPKPTVSQPSLPSQLSGPKPTAAQPPVLDPAAAHSAPKVGECESGTTAPSTSTAPPSASSPPSFAPTTPSTQFSPPSVAGHTPATVSPVAGRTAPDGFAQFVDGYFGRLYGTFYLGCQTVTRFHKVQHVYRALLQAEVMVGRTECEIRRRQRKGKMNPPMRRTGFLGLWGPKVPALDFWLDRVATLRPHLLEAQQAARTDKVTRSAFVAFRLRNVTTVAAQTVHALDGASWQVQEAAEARDVYWPNLEMRTSMRMVRRHVVRVVVFFIILFFYVPVTFVAALTTTENLAKTWPWLGQFEDNAFWNSFLTTFLPSVLLKVMMWLVPPVMLFLSYFEGSVAVSEAERKATRKHYYVQLFDTFFGYVFTGSLFSNLQAIIDHPRQIFEILAVSIPQTSTFFVTFVIISSLTLGLELAALPMPLLYYLWKTLTIGWENANREKAFRAGGPCYFVIIPHLLLVVTLGLVFAILAPVILPFVLLFVCIGYLTWKHQLLYVYDRPYHTGGRMWPQFVEAVFTALLISQCTLIGIFLLKSAFKQASLSAPLPLLTVYIRMVLYKRYDVSFRILPLEVATNVDEFVLKKGWQPELRNFAGLYVPDCMCPDAAAVDRPHTEAHVETGQTRPAGAETNGAASNAADAASTTADAASTTADAASTAAAGMPKASVVTSSATASPSSVVPTTGTTNGPPDLPNATTELANHAAGGMAVTESGIEVEGDGGQGQGGSDGQQVGETEESEGSAGESRGMGARWRAGVAKLGHARGKAKSAFKRAMCLRPDDDDWLDYDRRGRVAEEGGRTDAGTELQQVGEGVVEAEEEAPTSPYSGRRRLAVLLPLYTILPRRAVPAVNLLHEGHPTSSTSPPSVHPTPPILESSGSPEGISGARRGDKGTSASPGAPLVRLSPSQAAAHSGGDSPGASGEAASGLKGSLRMPGEVGTAGGCDSFGPRMGVLRRKVRSPQLDMGRPQFGVRSPESSVRSPQSGSAPPAFSPNCGPGLDADTPKTGSHRDPGRIKLDSCHLDMGDLELGLSDPTVRSPGPEIGSPRLPSVIDTVTAAAQRDPVTAGDWARIPRGNGSQQEGTTSFHESTNPSRMNQQARVCRPHEGTTRHRAQARNGDRQLVGSMHLPSNTCSPVEQQSSTASARVADEGGSSLLMPGSPRSDDEDM